jgi:prepilin-type N-terminal cleavage/methylation domain-containing protein
MKLNRGFTLIELLVVISIITLLSSVVLSSLSSARSKAMDSAVKAALKQLAIQSQNYRDTQGDFGASVLTCAAVSPATHFFKSDATAVRILANIATNAVSGTSIVCTTDVTGQLWAVSIAALKGGGNFCMDNSGGWFKSFTTNSNGVCS